MELNELNDFLVNHTGAQHFDADKTLYLKVFPNSKIKSSLENAGDYNKHQLDERMVYELISMGGLCDCSILENRGYTRDKDGFIVPLKSENEPDEFEVKLLEIDLDKKTKYNDLKALVFGLKLHAADQKVDTFLAILKDKKAELLAKQQPASPLIPETVVQETVVPETVIPEIVVPETVVPEVVDSAVTEKKSEDQEPNTQA